MRILHICNDYCGSKVHRNLYRELDSFDVEQTVYTYFRSKSLIGKNRFDSSSTSFVYRPILRPSHRVLYHMKINDVYKDINTCLHLSSQSYDLIHATTLFSDGALALQILKQYGIPYIVAVRNTDINDFMRFAPHTWRIGIEVLRNASKVVFISKALKNKFCQHLLVSRIITEIEKKIEIIPNGIDSYWLDHIRTEDTTSHSLVYVGRFDYNKNVLRVVKAVISLRSFFPDIHLDLIGGGGSQQKRIEELVAENKDCISYHGIVLDKSKLRELYSNNSVFIMASHHETFGLVYLEAMTQGLAVIYTKGQGIDEMFDKSIGISVNPDSIEDIKNAIKELLINRDNYRGCHRICFDEFNWSVIANKYVSVYHMAERTDQIM